MKVKDLRAQLDGLDDDLEIYEVSTCALDCVRKSCKNTVIIYISNINASQQKFSFDKTKFFNHEVLILI
jgi:hypothetical protein